MKNLKFYRIFYVLLLLELVFNVLAKKKDKDKIIIIGGSSGPGPMPYMHSSSSPQIIPFPIPIFLPMQHSMPSPPIYLPQPQMSYAQMTSHQPAAQHIYHHHQNSSPHIHFIELPVYRRQKYGHAPEMQHYTSSANSEQYQSSDPYPIYSDYSYNYGPTSVHRRSGLNSMPGYSFNDLSHLNHLKYRKKVNTMRRPKITRKKKSKVDSNRKKSRCVSNCESNQANDHLKANKSERLNRYVKYDDRPEIDKYVANDSKKNNVKGLQNVKVDYQNVASTRYTD